MTSLSRRELLKSSIAATTAAAAGLPVSTTALAQGSPAEAGWQWDKGVCRMCGTGCGIQVATKGGKVMATKGDPDAPVNRGLNCIKGYFNGKIAYGADRLTQPLLRMKDGRFDKNGAFTPVTWQVAMDEMERQFRKHYTAKGPAGVAIIGSGQYTIPEGYAAAKLMKAGFRSNNLDPNARHCMASAVVGFMQVFGIDEPANVYDDIELADTIVLCGANPAEAHPVLWSRMTDRKLSHKPTRIFNITTYANLSSDIADVDIVIKPSTDLALMNYLAREIVARGAVNMEFVRKHCVFAAGAVDIGYGMRPTLKFSRPGRARHGGQGDGIRSRQGRGDRPAPHRRPEGEAGRPHDRRQALADQLRRVQEGHRALHAGLRGRAGQGRRRRKPGQFQGQAGAAG
jgi:nitrate reductase NapA